MPAGSIATVWTGLQAPGGYGVANIPVVDDVGGQYLAAPLVTISGGSGTGALAIAQVNHATGVLTNFIVVNPGVGYQAGDVLTVALEGGGPLVSPTNFTISGAALAANASGGLTKNGGGILNLAGLNTFTGAINVAGGVLNMAYMSPAATNIVLAANAGMSFGIGGPNTLSEPVISNLLANSFGANNSVGLDTSAGSHTWGSGAIGGVADFYKFGYNTLALTNANTYTGVTYIMGGALRAEWGAGVPASSHMVLSGGAWETAAGRFVNAWGAGAGQFEIVGGTSGFSAATSPLIVHKGALGSVLAWGEPFFAPEAFVLNAPGATANIYLGNVLDMNGTNTPILVGAQTAYLAAGVTNTQIASGQGGLVKLGDGTLVISNGVNGVLRLQGNPGLYVSRGTLELHSGQIWSQNPGSNNDFVGRFTGDNATLVLAGNSIYSRSNNHLSVGNDAGSFGRLIITNNAQFMNTSRLVIGWNSGSTGIVDQTGGLLRNMDNTYLGNNGLGIYNLSGGQVTNNTTYIGTEYGSVGILNQSGGAFRALGTTVIGNNVGSVGAYYQRGGTYYGSNQLQIAVHPGSYGYFQISGNATWTNASWIQLGCRGTGLYYQHGGTNWVTGNGLLMGNGEGADQARSVFYITDGVYTSTQPIYLGYNNPPAGGGRAEFNVNGGAMTIANAMRFNRNTFTNMLSSTNIVNLNGGTLMAQHLWREAPGGVSEFNLNGGTLIVGASPSTATFMTGLDAAWVRAGGAVFNTQADTNRALIAQDLLAPTGRGVSAIPWAGPIGGFVGAPYVEIAGGSGFGATAVAQFNPLSGTVTGIVITSAGHDYAPGDTVTVTLTGGGSTNVALGAATLNPVASGGLTKRGQGLLILTGANTYAGETVVENGGLEAFYLASLPDANNLTVNGGAAFVVGPTAGTAGNSTNLLRLATNATIVAGQIAVGDGVGSTVGNSSMEFGSGDARLYGNLIVIGSGKQNSWMGFAGAGGTLTISNQAGTGRADVSLGMNRLGTGANRLTVLDLRGHDVSLYIGSLTNGGETGNSAGWGLSQVFFDQGKLDVQAAYVALKTGGNAGNNAVTGEVHIAGGTALFGSIELARNSVANSSNMLGKLNLEGGTITMGGNITRGGGAGPTTAVILMTNNATLDMGGFAIGSAGAPINVLQLESGTLRNVGQIHGGANWAKTGAGTLTIEGNNSYSGNLTVQGGTLRYNGAYTGGGLITVQNAATLMGTGSVAGISLLAGSTLAPGNSTGILQANGAVTMASGSTFEVELNGLTAGVEYDRLVMNSYALTLSNPDLVVLLGFTPSIGNSFHIVTGLSGFDPVWDGEFNGKPHGGTFTVNSTEFRIDYNSNDITLTVVPEPGTIGTVGLALLAGVLLRRRLRK